MYEKKQKRKSNPTDILDDVFDFADKNMNIDQLALGAALMVVAKSIYLKELGPEQTQDMIFAFAEGLENHAYEQKVTIH